MNQVAFDMDNLVAFIAGSLERGEGFYLYREVAFVLLRVHPKGSAGESSQVKARRMSRRGRRECVQ